MHPVETFMRVTEPMLASVNGSHPLPRPWKVFFKEQLPLMQI